MELGAHAADRPVRLGGKEDRDQPGQQVEVPRREPQSDGDGDQGHGERGQQLERRGGQERQPQGGHRLLAVALADRPHGRDLAHTSSVGDQRRKAAHDVDEVAGQPLERGPATVGGLLGGPPDEGGEEREQGQGQHDDHAARPVDDEQGPHRQDRHDGRVDQGGEVPRHVGLDRGAPLGGQGRPDGRIRPRLRRAFQPGSEQPCPQRSRHRDAGPRRGALDRVGQCGPSAERQRQQGDRTDEVVPVDHRGDQRTDGERTAYRRHALEHTGDAETDHRPAGLRNRPQQPRVHRPRSGHLRPGCGARRSACGTPSRSSPGRAARSA